MWGISMLGYPAFCLLNDCYPAQKDKNTNKYVDKFLAADSKSCLKDWSTRSTMHGKAAQYAKRLAAMDGVPAEQKSLVFAELERQINQRRGNNMLDLVGDVKALTAEQCKAILLELHDDAEVSMILDGINLKAVNYYDSERAKGKISALVDYMLSNNEGRPYDENEGAKGGCWAIGRDGLDSLEDALVVPQDTDLFRPTSTSRQRYPSSCSVSVQSPAVPVPVPHEQVELAPPFHQPANEDFLSLLDQRTNEGWLTEDVANVLEDEESGPRAMLLMNQLIETSTRAMQNKRAASYGLKTARKLLGRQFPESIRRMVKEFLQNNIKRSKFPQSYGAAIHRFDKLFGTVSPEPPHDEIDDAFLFDSWPDNSRQRVAPPSWSYTAAAVPLTSFYNALEDARNLLPAGPNIPEVASADKLGPDINPSTLSDDSLPLKDEPVQITVSEIMGDQRASEPLGSGMHTDEHGSEPTRDEMPALPPPLTPAAVQFGQNIIKGVNRTVEIFRENTKLVQNTLAKLASYVRLGQQNSVPTGTGYDI